MSIDALRQEYTGDFLRESDLNANPIQAFRDWFDLAREREDIPEPNAMTLATVNQDGAPSARIVLLKEIREDGFIFYTNYHSRKGSDIDSTSKAALVFWWEPLRRQVRIEGIVEKVDRATSQAYYSSRPRGSQIGAWVSEQSRVVESRLELDNKLDQFEQKFTEEEIPLPPHWGGFIVKPSMLEFWQGGPRRLHDRIRYRWKDGDWKVDRLEP